jgi:hypothetical protein
MSNDFVACLQVAGMVAIFQAQKRSMKADIDQHREMLSTLHVRFPAMPSSARFGMGTC